MTRAQTITIYVTILSMVAVTFVVGDGAAVADPTAGYVDDVPSATPSSLGELDLTQLQYGDPTEALDLIQPPSAGADGAASLAHPLAMPPGRAGVQPNLALTYNSSAGSGWVGTGWDLSVGAVTVDTAFGAPRYLAGQESETYLLDGARLFPNAIRTQLDPREAGPRSDWVRQLEDEHERITRHGDTPGTYCWEVADKEGNHRWYGGAPNGNGGCERDGSAILTAAPTGAPDGVAGDLHWALTYVEDISGNVMRFAYDRPTGVPIGQGSQGAVGVSLYLREITYTGFRGPDGAPPDEPAYRVRFLRDGDVPGASARRDVVVDASAGLPVVTRDLLRRVEVDHLGPGYYTSGDDPELVKGWTLEYEHGPFDKSLLARIGQFGTDGAGNEHAWHEFTWFDDVHDDQGIFRGFGEIEQWGNRTDSALVNIAAESALGTSWRAGGDGGAYIGFNPIIPSKIGSFGGSFNIAGGQTNEVSTLIDLDGDGLPDKVWLDGQGRVMYRPNLNRPGVGEEAKYENSWFGAAQTVTGIDSLGRSSDLRIDVHFEAYPVVAIQVGGGFGFSFGDRYFQDVNGNGRVDFIQPDGAGHSVSYNVLNESGVPTFVHSARATGLDVPLDPFVSSLANAEVGEVTELLENTSPRIDTVRRWLAPHTGRIRVEGTAELTAGTAYRGDGALVTVEHDGSQKWVGTLDLNNLQDPHDETFDVVAGEPVWFRLHVIDNAADDHVAWAPTITYVDGDGNALGASVDANGRSQVVYEAEKDFTLFGRGTPTPVTEVEALRVDVAVTTFEAGLSDELHVLLRHGRGQEVKEEYELFTVQQRSIGLVDGGADLEIEAPAVVDGDSEEEEWDWIEVHVVSDSPVDPTLFSVEVTTSDLGLEAPDLDGAPAEADVDINLDLPVVPNVQVFSRTDRTTPYEPVTAPEKDSKATVEVELRGLPLDSSTVARENPDPAVVTVKTLDGGVITREPLTLRHVDLPLSDETRLEGTTRFDFDADADEVYYLDVSVADPAVGFDLELVASTVTFVWTETEGGEGGEEVVDGGLAEGVEDGEAGAEDIEAVQDGEAVQEVQAVEEVERDGMFPSGNRGWAYAGYNADHEDANGAGPLVESQFEFQVATGGFDEDTEVPTASDAPSAADVRGDVASSFESALLYIPWTGPDSDTADRWRAGEKETLHGMAGTMQADRLGADTPLDQGPAPSGRQAPQMLTVNGDFNFMLGLIASFSAAAGGGRSLKDFVDYNGSGFPDIRSGSSIEYTGPRGGKAATTTAGENPFDTALSLGGGLGGSAVSISSTGGASKNNDGGGAKSNVEPTSTKSSRGMNLGLGFSVGSQWTNPLADGGAYDAVSGGGDAPDIQGDLAADRTSGSIIDRALIDMNGDGLPDRVDTYTSGELWVNLNLGYRFAGEAILWSTGRTSANKDVGGSLSAGFQLNAYEFAGGVAYSEGVGQSLFDWIDIDGDGVPDRMNNVGDGEPQTIFGSGDGMRRDEMVYGEYFRGNVAVDADRWQSERDDDGNLRGVNLPGGQMEVSRSTGLSGGVDFAFYIGPICVVACYVVINPGVHGGYDRMTSQVQMVDMNGNGLPDAVRSTDRNHIEVRLNQRGRTDLLEAVTNPLGGQVRLDYERTGNTIENPQSVWVMSSVEVDDGRAGDGVDVQRSEFTYEGNVYDPLLRELLGFSEVREDQLDEAGKAVRSFEREYLNGDPFESGLLVEERTLDPTADDRVVQSAEFTWRFANADPHGVSGERNGAFGDVVADALPAVRTSARTALFDMALSPRLVTDRLTRWDAGGEPLTTVTHYTYNAIGDVLTVHERNQTEIDADDTFTQITYSACASRSGERALTGDQTWVSVPATVTLFGGDDDSGEILRHRNGGPDLCANAAPVRIAELVQPDADADAGCTEDLFAITELSFDDHGSYDAVARPANAVPSSCADYPEETVDAPTFEGCASLSPEDDATRYCVDYVYDDHRFTDIAEVTDNHGVSSSATYDPFTGRFASSTDPNGNRTTYTYDRQGRLASVTAPRERGGTPTVTYRYGGLDATRAPAGEHAWATAHHHDALNDANTTIDTATFVDGTGRVVQRKRDAEVEAVAGAARIVEGAVEYDALGREVNEWYPVVEVAADRALVAYNTWTSADGPATTGVPETDPTVRAYDIYDRVVKQTLPDDSIETVAYAFEALPGSQELFLTPVVMSRVESTDALGKVSTRWLDVGGAVFRRVDEAAEASPEEDLADLLAALPVGGVIDEARIADSLGTTGDIVTTYDYDRLGRLVSVVDAAGARTEHTYDLQDAVTSTRTPDGGLVEYRFAPSGQMLTLERAVGTIATYAYDRDRLVGVTYSDGTPSVAYEYGDDGAPENAAGRVTLVSDGAMDRAYGYDVDGNVAREIATRHPNPFDRGGSGAPSVWETAWAYDSLGRLDVLTYPDGEALSHEYDLGGRPERLVSQAPQHDLYDQYGDAVPRPDMEIVYIDEVAYDEFGAATYLRTGTGVETRYDHEPTRRFLSGISTESTATEQHDGSTSTAQPLQNLEYTYDAVGNVRDVVNRLYAGAADSAVTDLGPPPVNNVPGPSHHAFTYDGHYRLTAGEGTYVDQRELREFDYETDYGPNGNLLAKRQVTTTTSTVSQGGGGGRGGGNQGGGNQGGGGGNNAKKGDGAGTDDGTTTEDVCDSNTGSGGGSFNQDPTTTYVIGAGDLEYETDTDNSPTHRIVRAGTREYTHDANGNMTGWVDPCAQGAADISRSFDWDAENRLVRIAEGNNDTNFRYTAEGALALTRGPGGTTWFVNEHWRVVNEGHRYANVFLGGQMIASHRTSPPSEPPLACTDTDEEPCECSSSDACLVQDETECDLDRRIYDPVTGTCQPMESRTLHFLHKDLQGSLRVATDDVGKVFQYLDYLPSGERWIAGQSRIFDTPYLFAGGWNDRTYKIMNFGERWYDPRHQGFLTPEPLLEENPFAVVDDPSLLSAYTYAAANPLKYVDATGRAPNLAQNGFVLGDTAGSYDKHEGGDITISVAGRAARAAPAITFGGRYGNDAAGQKLGLAFQKHADRADRFSTVLSISTEDGVKKTRVFGITAKKQQVAPKPGKAGSQTPATTPPSTTGAPPKPGATTAADSTGTAGAGPAPTGGGPTAGGPAVAPPPAGAGGNNSPTPPPPPPPPPLKAAATSSGPPKTNS